MRCCVCVEVFCVWFCFGGVFFILVFGCCFGFVLFFFKMEVLNFAFKTQGLSYQCDDL